jgi:L-ascorbate metabolism protein UlaG (beta-lactamase superfamily)
MIENIHWLGHAGFRIEEEKVVYIDPWQLAKGAKKADIILITHDHYDHFSEEDVEEIRKEDTVVVTIGAVAKKLKGDVRIVKAGERLTVEGIPIEAMPAYNIKKAFHPKAAGGVGFVFTLGGKRIYHPGDTDFIPEMREVKADVVLMPVGGTYTMTAEEAAKAANEIKPEVAIPMHYGTIVGSLEDAKRFKELCEMEVVILPKE